MLRFTACIGLCLLSPTGARADVEMEYFTKSIAEVYRVSTMCSGNRSFDSKGLAMLVMSYLGQFYPDGVPYWALPQVHERIKDKNTCFRMLGKSLSSYKEASRELVENHPDLPFPPTIQVVLSNRTDGPSLNVVRPNSGR